MKVYAWQGVRADGRNGGTADGRTGAPVTPLTVAGRGGDLSSQPCPSEPATTGGSRPPTRPSRPKRPACATSPTTARASAAGGRARASATPARRQAAQRPAILEPHPDPRHPPGLHRRLDLPARQRPPPGHRPRRRGRKQYRYHAELARRPRRDQVRPDDRLRPRRCRRSASEVEPDLGRRACRARRWSRPWSSSWRPRGSASATTSTPSRTAPSA